MASPENRLAIYLQPVFSNAAARLGPSPLTAASGWLLAGIVLSLIIVSIYITSVIFIKRNHIPDDDSVNRKGVIKLAYNKFYIDEIYNALFVRPLSRISLFLSEKIDIRIFDKAIESVGKAVMFAGGKIRLLQTGNVGFYLFTMVIFIIIVLVLNLIY